MRVQTTGQVPAAEVLQTASTNVGQVCDHLSSVFTTAMQEFEAKEKMRSRDTAKDGGSQRKFDSMQGSTGTDEMNE